MDSDGFGCAAPFTGSVCGGCCAPRMGAWDPGTLGVGRTSTAAVINTLVAC